MNNALYFSILFTFGVVYLPLSVLDNNRLAPETSHSIFLTLYRIDANILDIVDLDRDVNVSARDGVMGLMATPMGDCNRRSSGSEPS